MIITLKEDQVLQILVNTENFMAVTFDLNVVCIIPSLWIKPFLEPNRMKVSHEILHLPLPPSILRSTTKQNSTKVFIGTFSICTFPEIC